MPNREKLFTQRIKLNDGSTVEVDTFTNGFDNRGATRYQLHVKHAGKVIFNVNDPQGAELYGAHSPSWTSDGKDAKRASLTHLAMKPGDTDSEFFSSYTADQLAWVEQYGEEIYMIAIYRYGED